MRYPNLTTFAAASALALLAACGKSTSPDTQAEAALEADVADKQAELDARQAELQRLQSELAAQKQANDAAAAATAAAEEQAKRDAAKPKPVVRNTTPKPNAAPKPSASGPDRIDTPAAPVVTTLTVPSGTELPLSLTTGLSSKTAKPGDTVRAVLTRDITVDGRTAIASGTTVAGAVVKVVSGSEKIGGTPTLVVGFDRIELPGGTDVPISGEVTTRGKSDNTRDTVKIVGGAAAGALLGDQVSSKDRGKVIGGLLGAAAGAVAAQKTGTEVKLEEGTPLAITLASSVDIKR